MEMGRSVGEGLFFCTILILFFVPEGHQSAGVTKAVASCTLYLQFVTRGYSVCDGQGVGGTASM